MPRTRDHRAALARVADDLELIRAAFRLDYDSGDPWGSVMLAWFEVAHEPYHRAPERIPSSWRFRAGLSVPRPELSDPYGAALRGAQNVVTLVLWGEILERFARRLEGRGRDY